MIHSFKMIALWVAAGVLLFGLGFGYSWYKDRSKLAELSALQAAIQKEQSSCQAFINTGSGDFNHFAYCQQFLSWAKSL